MLGLSRLGGLAAQAETLRERCCWERRLELLQTGLALASQRGETEAEASEREAASCMAMVCLFERVSDAMAEAGWQSANSEVGEGPFAPGVLLPGLLGSRVAARGCSHAPHPPLMNGPLALLQPDNLSHSGWLRRVIQHHLHTLADLEK